MTRYRSTLAAAAFAAAAIASAGAANAKVTFFSYGLGAPALPLVTDFSTDSVGHAPTHLPAGYSWSGVNAKVLDTTGVLGAEPGVVGGVHGTGNYLSNMKGSTETLTLPGDKTVGLYIGSLDGYNSLTFTLKNGHTESFTGTQLGAISGSSNGDQTGAMTNGVFDFSFGSPIEKITFNSGFNSLEIKDITGTISSLVPEPTTWGMLILGVAMIGFALRRRSDAPVAAA